MMRFRESAIVGGFSFGEVGDGEQEPAGGAGGFGAGAGSIGGLAADETAAVADS